MPIIHFAVCVAFLLGSSMARAQESVPDRPWTWVLADGIGAEGDSALSQSAQKHFRFYQERSIYPGALVPESELEERPSGPTVFLGPAGYFLHPDWLEPLLFIDGDRVTLGGQVWDEPGTGLYVRSEDGQRVAYTGLGVEGFQGIFTVRTGRAPATVSRRRRVLAEGYYRAGDLALTRAPFLPMLPTAEELRIEFAGSEEVEASASITAVHDVDEVGSETGLSAPFRERMDQLVADKQVLFFGEHHWNVTINQLFTDLLGWLLEHRGVGTVFLEESYSHSSHMAHYVTLKSEDAAERFWVESLRPLVAAQSTRDVLETIRAWNRAHPEAAVAVACLDAEFDYRRTLEDVLSGYFRASDPDFEVRLSKVSPGRAALREALRMRILLAEEGQDAAQHPWMTPEFVGNALTNLEESVRASGREDRMAQRQRSIVRNVTVFHGDRFGPEALEHGLVVFKEGGAHADRAATRDDGAWWEAAYLDREFEPTRGGVASMMVEGVGYRFDLVGDVDRRTHQQWATNYHTFVDDYRSGLRTGAAVPGRLYALNGGELSLDRRVALHRSFQALGRCWLRDSAPGGRQDGRGARPPGFDEVVFVMGGQLEPTLPRSGD